VAGRVDRLKRLRPALITTFSPSTASDTETFFGQGAQNIQEFAARNRDITGVLNHTSVEATSSTSRSVAVIDKLSLAHAKQHIGPYRHGLASFHRPPITGL